MVGFLNNKRLCLDLWVRNLEVQTPVNTPKIRPFRDSSLLKPSLWNSRIAKQIKIILTNIRISNSYYWHMINNKLVLDLQLKWPFYPPILTYPVSQNTFLYFTNKDTDLSQTRSHSDTIVFSSRRNTFLSYYQNIEEMFNFLINQSNISKYFHIIKKVFWHIFIPNPIFVWTCDRKYLQLI